MKKKLLAFILACSMIAEGAGTGALPVYAAESDGIVYDLGAGDALEDGQQSIYGDEEIVSEDQVSLDNTEETVLDEETGSDMKDTGEEQVSEYVDPDDALTYGDFEYSEQSDGTVSINKYTGEDTTVSIPSTIDGKSVTRINYNIFYNATNVESVTIPATVTQISSGAFSKIKHVTFANGFTEIPNSALYNADQLESVTLPSGITKIGTYAFYSCENLSSISIPSTVTEIGNSAFYGCTSLSTVTLPSGLEEISSSLFYNCTGLRTVNIPSGVKKIDYYAFYGCSSLTKIDLPAQLENIENYAFNNCSDLKYSNLVLPDTLKSVGYNAFAGCTGIECFTLPAGLTNVSSGAFKDAKEIKLADGIEKIPSSIFYGSENLTKFIVPSSVTEIGSSAFYDCKNLVEVTLPKNLTKIGYSAFYNCTALSKINLPDTLTDIEGSAFYNCSSLSYENLVLPTSLTNIGYNCFQGCTGIKCFTLPAGIESIGSNAFKDAEDVKFATGTTVIPQSIFSGSTKITEYEVPEGITEIGSYAFQNCENLTTINLPSTLTKIGYNAFYNCKSLTTINFPSSLTDIEGSAFYNCTSLTYANLILPESVKSVGYNAFYGCTGIESFTIPQNIEDIGNGAFSSAKEIHLAAGLTKLPNGIFSGSKTLTSIEIPATVTEIGSNAFYGCESLTSVDLPKGLTKIGYSAFNNCTVLETVTFPGSLTEIEGSAFYRCTSLKTVNIPAGTKVGYNAFYECSGLEKLTIGDNAEIGQRAFQGCSSLKEFHFGNDITIDSSAFEGVSISGTIENTNITYDVTINDGLLTISGTGAIPDFTASAPAPWVSLDSMVKDLKVNPGITSIGEYAFAGLSGVVTVMLPEGLSSIGKYAFKNCTALEYVEFPDGLKTVDEGAFEGCANMREIVFCGDAPSINSKAFPAKTTAKRISAYYPQTATGWSKQRYQTLSDLINWETWDDTQATKDVVLVLDHSGSMSGKMEKLHEAAGAFINGVGGRRQNTRIAVVKYDDTAEVLSDFSTDCTSLVRKVNTLKAEGGTEYLKALNKAEEVIKNSDAEKKSLIMFSDGEPNDNKDNIYAKAKELSTKYTIYTVGLMSGYSSDDRYREVLINVAGSEKRYFEADDMNGLLQAFLNLSKDMGRQEKTTAEVLRHNVRHDLMQDYMTFTKGSFEEIDLTILPGLELGDYEYVSLSVNGQDVMTSANGHFTLAPGSIFAPGDLIYAVTYDSYGRVLEQKRLGIVIVDVYKITYLMNDDEGTVYREDTVIGGADIIQPEDPERDGYRFLGWYTTKDGAGFDFFSMYNSFNRMKIETNLNLYAHWAQSSSTLDTSKDIWNFYNSSDAFLSEDYEISSGDYSRLLASTDSTYTKQRLKNMKADEWGGSCFGMSSGVVLNRQGRINITEFDPASLYVRQAPILANEQGDIDVGNIESMINFYQLRQAVGNVYSALCAYTDDESANIGNIIQKLKTSSGPCVLVIHLYSGSQIEGGHAVVAYDFEEVNNDSWKFKVYDCSMGPDNAYPITVSRSGGRYTANLGTWPTDWGYTIFLCSAMNEEDLTSEAYLTEPSFSFQNVRAGNGVETFVETSYGDYTISDGTKSAQIKDGKPESGDLEVNGYGKTSEVGAAPIYRIGLFAEDGKKYTITQGEGAKTYTTDIFSYDEDDGFVVDASASANGTITFDNNGYLKTSYAAETQQTIGVTTSQMNTTWYHVDIVAASTGLSLKPATSSVAFSSDSQTKAEVTVSSDFNSYTFTDVDVTSTESVVTEESGKTVIKTGSTTNKTADFGYSVVFDSRLGTAVEPMMNVTSGSTIEEPLDPQRNGFLFTGWFKDEDCKTLWDFENDKVTSDTTLYAGWSLDENYFLIVNFRVKGEEALLLYQQKGTKLAKESCPVTEDGKALKWYSDVDCTVEWDFDTVLERNTELYSPDWNFGRKTEGDVPSEEIPEGGIPEGVWVGGLTSPVYTGSAVTPSFHVYDGSKLLVANKDYTVKLKNNVNAYEIADPSKLTDADKKNAPQIQMTMKGNYSGAQTIYFSISRSSIAASGFEAHNISKTYTGAAQKPDEKSVVLYYNGKALKYGTDYKMTLDPADDYKGSETENIVYKVTLEGMGNYTGSRDINCTIYAKKSAGGNQMILINDKSISISKIPDQTYIGRAYTAADLKDKTGKNVVLVKLNGKELVEGTDYKAEFKDAKNAGVATVVLTGLEGTAEGSQAAIAGTMTLTFKIKGTPISKAVVEGIEKGGYEYTGQAIKPDVSLKGIVDSDYSVKFENNVNAGTASVIFTGKNGYEGTKKVTFKIKKRTINNNNTLINNGVSVTVPYNPKGAVPNVSVTCGGRTLKAGVDYKVTCKNNKSITSTGRRAKKATIQVQGIGNYAGSASGEFSITRATMTGRVSVIASNVVYNKKAGKYMAKVIVKDENGNVLKANKDYNKRLTYQKVNSVSSSGYESLSSLNKKKDAPEAGTKIKVTVTGRGNWTGSAYGYYYIINADKDLSKTKISIKNQTYTGSEILINSADQFSQLTDAKGTPLKFGTEEDDIVIESITGNKNAGTATVVFAGTGDGVNGYCGRKTVTFKIVSREVKDNTWWGWFAKLVE